ncbi:MAG: hypothetical protein RLZZ196_2077 [Bacteroidota bacterium]|jgi:NurA-like 5'-3' nuclease
MAQKSEKLPNDVVEKIKTMQAKLNDLVFSMGQISLQLRDLKEDVKKGEEYKLSIETKFDETNKEFNETLKELEQKYPKGEIDLNEGAVYYESPE